MANQMVQVYSILYEHLLPRLQKAISTVIYTQCYGCQVDHPSQQLRDSWFDPMKHHIAYSPQPCSDSDTDEEDYT